MEDIWSKARDLPSFPSCSVQEDHEETDLSTDSITGDNLDKSEPFIETSNIFIQVDQRTSEYHETKLPGGTGDSIAYHCADSSSEDILDIPESAEREGSETAEREFLQMESQPPTDEEQLSGMFNVI